MKSSVWLVALLTACMLGQLPLPAQDGPGVPAPPPPNGPYEAPPDAGAQPPPPDQGGPQGDSDQGASFQTFYDNLGSQGTWIQSSDYGYVWQPNVTDPGWAPYTAGHWVYTDAGWTWASDEPWGWATYHYGRWVNLNGTGWCWVPGYTWAPAWVSWRYGGGYCGWAPLPPDSFVGIDYAGDGIEISAGFHIGGDCDSYYGIGAAWYNFVPVTCLGYSNYHGYYCPRYNNYAIANVTTNVTNLNVNRPPPGQPHGQFGNVSTGGPSLAQVNAVSQKPVPTLSLANSSHLGGGRVSNNSFAVYAPSMSAGGNVRPTHVGATLGQTTINRGADPAQPLAVSRKIGAPSWTSSQVQQAQLAQFNAPPHAKVITASTPIQPLLQSPVSSMQPVASAFHTHTPTQTFTPSASNQSSAPFSTQTVTRTTSSDGGTPVTTQTVTHVYSNQSSSDGGNNSPAVYTPGSSHSQPTSYNQQPSTSTPNGYPGGYYPHSNQGSSQSRSQSQQSQPDQSQSQSSQPQYQYPSTPSGNSQNSNGYSNNQGGYSGGGGHNGGNGGGGGGWGNHGGGNQNWNNNQQQNH